MENELKTFEAFNSLDGSHDIQAALYSALMEKLKPRGSNYTPPKKKRKKRK
jgi:hypothetical protein